MIIMQIIIFLHWYWLRRSEVLAATEFLNHCAVVGRRYLPFLIITSRRNAMAFVVDVLMLARLRLLSSNKTLSTKIELAKMMIIM